MLLTGKPSISIRAIYTMAMLVITKGYPDFQGCKPIFADDLAQFVARICWVNSNPCLF